MPGPTPRKAARAGRRSHLAGSTSRHHSAPIIIPPLSPFRLLGEPTMQRRCDRTYRHSAPIRHSGASRNLPFAERRFPSQATPKASQRFQSDGVTLRRQPGSVVIPPLSSFRRKPESTLCGTKVPRPNHPKSKPAFPIGWRNFPSSTRFRHHSVPIVIPAQAGIHPLRKEGPPAQPPKKKRHPRAAGHLTILATGFNLKSALAGP